MSEIEPSVHFDKMNRVVSELLRGNSATQIATITGFTRKEVLEYIRSEEHTSELQSQPF
jgi:hypothetical protein